MAKELKKTSLLSEAEKQKLLKKGQAKKPVAAASAAPARSGYVGSASAPARAEAVTEPEVKPSKAKYWLGLAVLLLVAVVICPKPQLVHYQTAGMTTSSVYMPGWFGGEGRILDTKQRAVLSEQEQSLYLCFSEQKTEQCIKYQVKQQQGPVAALLYLSRQ